MSTAWKEFEQRYEAIFAAHSIQGLLHWDMQTCMPSGASEQRTRQLAYLETHLHGLLTDEKLHASLRELDRDAGRLEPWQRGSVRWHLRKVEARRKIPTALAREASEAEARGFETWREARAKKDFAQFLPALEHNLRIRREIGAHLKAPGQTEYEALVDTFEPGVPIARIRALLEGVRRDLVPLIPRIVEKQNREFPTTRLRRVPRAEQERLNRRVLEAMGFDFAHGRLDVAAHPFCGGAGTDIRLTTRYDEEYWPGSLFAAIHEGGHGLYEQGMERFAPHFTAREAASYGSHESQSRFWENHVGRSRAFCDWLGARLETPETDLFEQVNRVRPTLIRVQADEATYNLHILLRFELEEALFSGNLAARDLPGAWNEKMKAYLGIVPPDDSQGVLQDVHWGSGSFGYFPTYTLGNLIAAQLDARLRSELDLDAVVRAGEFPRIRDWLNREFHARGCTLSMLELVREATGQELGHEAFIRYLEGKFLGK